MTGAGCGLSLGGLGGCSRGTRQYREGVTALRPTLAHPPAVAVAAVEQG